MTQPADSASAALEKRPQLVLASSSPRRQDLLREAGYQFIVDPSGIDEDDFPRGTMPAELAIILAKLKAQAVAARHPDDIVLAADTVVALGDEIIGKADDPRHAREILRLLAGTTHVVVTGVAVARDAGKRIRTARIMSAVKMKNLTPIDLETYLLSGLWRGKAGAYGVQDANSPVLAVIGCRTNVIGLPMTKTRDLLSEAGVIPAPYGSRS